MCPRKFKTTHQNPNQLRSKDSAKIDLGLISVQPQHHSAQQQDAGRCQPLEESGKHCACLNITFYLVSEYATGTRRPGSRPALKQPHLCTLVSDMQSLVSAQAKRVWGDAAPVTTAYAIIFPGKSLSTQAFFLSVCLVDGRACKA